MLVLISFPRHSFCAHRYTSCNQFYTPAFYQTRQILLASSSMRRMAFGYSGVGKENQFQAVSNLHTTGTCTELYCMITYRSLTMREDKERGGGGGIKRRKAGCAESRFGTQWKNGSLVDSPLSQQFLGHMCLSSLEM